MLAKLPADFDLKQFVGRSLETVEFGQWKVNLVLTDGYVIGVEDKMSVNDSEPIELPAILPLIYPLLNQKVKAVSVLQEAGLVIEFERQDKLFICALDEPYESYQIEQNGKALAVV